MTRDALAGATTAVMLVPQAMAYALLAGLDPILGLYASTWSLFAYALLGRTPQLAIGPTALNAMLAGAALSSIDADGSAGEAALLAVLTGAVLVGVAALRLGTYARLLTPSILGGFTTAAAVLIGVSQVPLLLGITVERSSDLVVSVQRIVGGLVDVRPLVVGIGVVTAVGLVVAKRRAPRFPRFLVAVLLGVVVTWACGLDLPTVGGIPRGVNGLVVPPIEHVVSLAPWALGLAAIATLETLSIGAHFVAEGQRAPDRDLLGVGGANVAAGLTGGMNVSAGFSRSAVHAEAGAEGRRSSAVTGVAVCVVLLGLTGPLAFLPKVVLAAIIVSALPGFVRVALARRLWSTDRVAFVGFVATCVASLVAGVLPGLLVGLVLEHAARAVQQSASAIQ